MVVENLNTGQRYKNYKVLCDTLCEPVKTNRTLQLENWKRYFSFHKEGNSYVIDEIFDTPVEKMDGRRNNGGARNTKNIDIIVPYLSRVLYNIDAYKSYTFTSLLCEQLGFFNEDICNAVYQSNELLAKQCNKHNIKDHTLLREYVSSARQFAKRLVLNGLKRIEDYDYKLGYLFTYKLDGKTKGHFFTDDVNLKVKEIERTICNECNKEFELSSKISGRQLLFIIYNDVKYIKYYNLKKIEKMMGDEDFISALNKSKEFDDGTLYAPVSEDNPLLYYCEAVYIGGELPCESNKSVSLKEVKELICEKARRVILNKYNISYGNKEYKYRTPEHIEEIKRIENALFETPIDLPFEDDYSYEEDYRELELLFA